MRISTLMILSIVAAGLTGGCATHQDRVPAVVEERPYYAPAAAAALAFDPPMMSYAPVASFSREGRSPSAFYGYEQPSVDSYYLYQRDQQRGQGIPDRFDRTTYSTRATTTYR